MTGQGHILTNNHVVEGAEKLLVALPDGRSFQAKLIGRDPQTDLAVLQISGSDLPLAELGDSNQLQGGGLGGRDRQRIGAGRRSHGLRPGVVSALGRTSKSRAIRPPRVHTSLMSSRPAPDQPGQFGGTSGEPVPGQVVGINTLVAGQAEPGVPAQGIGFAISIAAAKPIADQLVATGKVIYPYLGMSDIDLNPAIAAQLGTTEKEGIVIRRVGTRVTCRPGRATAI